VHREIKKNPVTADESKADRMVGKTGIADRSISRRERLQASGVEAFHPPSRFAG